jgi:hypothetical protein
MASWLRVSRVSAFAVVAAIAGWSGGAGAQERCEARRGCVTLAATVGYGFEQRDEDFEEVFGEPMDVEHPNAYALGLGLRGGYTFRFGLYVGGQMAYFLGSAGEQRFPAEPGSSRDVGGISVPREGGTIVYERSTFLFGPEVGYDFRSGPFLVRPTLANGALSWSQEACLGDDCEDDVDAKPFLAPGLTLGVISRPFYVGAQFEYLVTFDAPEPAPGPVIALNLGIAL